MVTSRDVARLAGVSQPTVSRALRGDRRVSSETRERVQLAASQLAYVPSSLGRALSLGRAFRVGLLVTDLENRFYPHLIAPVHDTLAEVGYELILMTDDHDRGEVTERVRSNGLDGVILATTEVHSAVPLRLREKDIPFVYFNRIGATVETDSVTSNPTVGLEKAIDELVARGHRVIAAAHGPLTTSTGARRAESLRLALAKHGLAIRPEHEVSRAFTTTGGGEALKVIMAGGVAPTAIICGNDVMAIGVVNAARELGLGVPEDISVVGYDDLPEASWPILDLTTIAFDLRGMAARAAHMMASRIANPERPYEHAEFESRLVVRGTTGSPAIR